MVLVEAPLVILMKISVKNLVLCLSFLLSSHVTCSISAECKTGKSVVLEKFTADTTELFTKIPEIKSCGDKYLVSPTRDHDGYKNCISRIGLPENYEPNIANLSSFDFKNDIDFRNSIKSAATKICFDLEFENFDNRDDITKKAYKVTGLYTNGQVKNISRPKDEIEEIHSDNNSDFESSFQTTVVYMFGGFVIMVALIFSIVFICIRLNSDVLSDKHVAEINIKRNEPMTQVQNQTVQPTVQYTFSPALSANNDAPPSYHEVGQEYSKVPSSMVNPYSGKGPNQ